MGLLKKPKLFLFGFFGILVASGLLFPALFPGKELALGQPGMNTFPTTPPGQAEKLKRPYQGAPPLIPHSLDGFGITRSGNDCLTCHSEGIELDKGHIATKVPPSHYVNEYTGEQKKEQVIGVRYNCLQCHVPQAQEDPSLPRKEK